MEPMVIFTVYFGPNQLDIPMPPEAAEAFAQQFLTAAREVRDVGRQSNPINLKITAE